MAKTQSSPKAQTNPKAPAKAKTAPTAKPATKIGTKSKQAAKATRPTTPATAIAASAPPTKTKLQIVIDLLGRPQGASIGELMSATGWQAHSVRGALAGALKKKGLEVGSAKLEGGRRYSIVKAGRA
jgi:hypothetical protein